MVNRVVIAFCLVVFSAGCASSNYLAEKPLVLYPQGVLAQDVQTRSMKALLNSFSENKWVVRKVINKEKKIVMAENCELICAEVQATVKKDGSIEILRSPLQSLDADGSAKLKRWLARVKKSYEKNMKTRS